MNAFKDAFNKAREFNHHLKAKDESKLVMAPVIVEQKEEPAKKDEAKKDEAKKDEVKKDEVKKDEAKKDDTKKDEAKKTA